MGRGLSDLQKSILRLAYLNHVAEKDDRNKPESHRADAYYSEILVDHFLFPIADGLRSWRDKELSDVQVARKYHASHTFDRSVIGMQRYASAQAALSRATKRLEERGLVTCLVGHARWSGVELTEAGIAEAEKLMVNTSVNLPKS